MEFVGQQFQGYPIPLSLRIDKALLPNKGPDHRKQRSRGIVSVTTGIIARLTGLKEILIHKTFD